MNEAAETSSHLATFAILLFYWAVLNLWPKLMLPGEDEKSTRTTVCGSIHDHALQLAPSISTAIDAMHRIDHHFDPRLFVAEATAAYERVIKAYADMDLETLGRLVSPEVLKVFADEFTARQQRQGTLDLTLVGVQEATIADVNFDGEDAEISIRFASEMISVERDPAEVVIAGNPKAIIPSADLWVFARNFGSTDRSWLIIATGDA